MTTLSDEEFTRLNNQLLELKVQNYNLEASLAKSTVECNTLKGENEQLRKQLATHVPSIKQKLNPFALAKNIANKVDARIHANAHGAHNSGSTAANSEPSNEYELKPSSSTHELAHRLESQESDFLKTNETLKSEISLLQSQLEASEANNRQLRDEIDRLSAAASQVPNESNADNSAEQQAYSPSRQLQQSLQVFSTSLAGRQQKDATDLEKLVEGFSELLQQSELNVEEAIETVIGVLDKGRIQDEDLMNTTEDFKQICQFFERSYLSQLDDAKQLIGLLCRSLVAYRAQQRREHEDQMATETGKLLGDIARLEAEIDQLQTHKQAIGGSIRRMGQQLNELKMAKKAVESLLAQLTAITAEEFSRLKAQSKDLIESITADYERRLALSTELHQASQLQLEEAQRQIEALHSKVNEGINERKISEKRGFKIIKELKKQLNAEKSRADKLQSILNSESGDLTDSTPRSTHNSPSGRPTGAEAQNAITSDKCSSSGSWSYMNETPGAASPSAKPRQGSVHSEFSDIEIVNSPAKGDNAVAGSGSRLNVKGAKPRGASMNSVSSGTLEQENAQLVARVSNLQQEKWRLEEQLNQLEHKIALLAEELADKNRLIEYYCIEGRPVDVSRSHESMASSPTSPQHSRSRQNSTSSNVSSSKATSLNSSVLRVVSFLKESTSGSVESAKHMAEVNRKLQRMVEEILVKNMSLQDNLNDCSNQLMEMKTRLRQYEQP